MRAFSFCTTPLFCYSNSSDVIAVTVMNARGVADTAECKGVVVDMLKNVLVYLDAFVLRYVAPSLSAVGLR